MVKNRVIWEQLKNIQVFSGLSQLFFAFKKLDPKEDLDITLKNFLKPKGEEYVNFESDIGLERYQKYLDEDGIFLYDSMPLDFYLKKIFEYSKIDVDFEYDLSKEKDKIIKEGVLINTEFIEQIIIPYFKKEFRDTSNISIDSFTDAKEISWLRKLFSFWSKYKKNNRFRKVIDEYFKIFQTSQNLNFEQFFGKSKIEKLEFLELLYKTKTFDNGKGR